MAARADRVIGVVLLCVAGFWAGQTARIDDPGIDGTIGPRVFPWLLSGLLAVLAVLLVVRTFRGGGGSEASGETRPRAGGGVLETEWGAVGTTFGLLIAYISLLEYIGFLVATPVVVLATTRGLMRERSWIRALALSLGVTATIYLVFGRFFSVPLPTGRLLG